MTGTEVLVKNADKATFKQIKESLGRMPTFEEIQLEMTSEAVNNLEGQSLDNTYSPSGTFYAPDMYGAATEALRRKHAAEDVLAKAGQLAIAPEFQ